MQSMSSQGTPFWSFCPNSGLQVNSVAISDDGKRCVFGTSFERGEGDFSTVVVDCASSSTMQINSYPIADGQTTQGVFWVDISGDGEYVASGGQTSENKGFVFVYEAGTGKLLLQNTTPNSRVNQVSLSQSGEYLAFCYGSTIEAYKLSADASSYESIFSHTFTDFTTNSCMLSANGETLVVSCIQYEDDTVNGKEETVTKGQVASFSIKQDTVTALAPCAVSTGCMRVAVVDSGVFWAASLHDGSCVLIDREVPNKTQWQTSPPNINIMLAYAVAITQTDEGKVFVACGANADGGSYDGYLYFVESELLTLSDLKYSGVKFAPKIVWSVPIKRSVNPGVSIDKNAHFVTATDGKPVGQTVQESAGSFYLFDALSGENVWTYDTTMMNWPMMLSKDGTRAFGGSDEGHVYFWKTSLA